MVCWFYLVEIVCPSTGRIVKWNLLNARVDGCLLSDTCYPDGLALVRFDFLSCGKIQIQSASAGPIQVH